MTTALVPFSDMHSMAEAIAKSKLFGMQTVDQALALMIVAQAEGRHPGSVAAEYHIIQNRPALKADAMLARFQQAGGKVAWADYTDTSVSAVFTHEAGGSVKIEWTMDRAKKAGLTGKDNWTKYPRQMLRARVISEGVRTCYPAVCVGVYTPEEVGDFEPAAPKRGRPPKDMGAADVVQDADDDALKGVEQAPAPTPPPQGMAIDSPGKTRTQMLTDLCEQAAFNFIDLLAKAEVGHADELSDEDYESAKVMLRKRITKRMVAEAGEQQP